ncbi:hypothetical protein GLOIN_2v1475289 [Rhizophagus irregularis DAOM 181602=DAOM 197198]|uniref:Uncharacterized protein n=2 Tax=Rhizophagus irregularis TaxID=588596 RepID=A0A2P4QD72_RHIID|nr:hypothetical protein GLOIN_2v1475289 [Rhizophagus irregularis DAOM 181602=DAOM 197198]POG75580.1 hypothetical protein GLOIN_2v1475289 [Rhizophagus irregularis DAOM 181602=DAOM 197198]|eukprot:XP_025182446.1 hypothetical protein GLOIN_2v1475289 [Rhizophagus irregularis DAOM 181602=DAOM 197198]
MSKTMSKTGFGQSKIVQLKKPIGQIQNPTLPTSSQLNINKTFESQKDLITKIIISALFKMLDINVYLKQIRRTNMVRHLQLLDNPIVLKLKKSEFNPIINKSTRFVSSDDESSKKDHQPNKKKSKIPEKSKKSSSIKASNKSTEIVSSDDKNDEGHQPKKNSKNSKKKSKSKKSKKQRKQKQLTS